MKFLTIFCLLIDFHAHAKPLAVSSSNEKTSLVELYTSEGCSSCPPAEAFINKLSSHPGLFDSFVPVVFHVDYWNYLGWKDPYSSKANSSRQRKLFRAMGANNVYTPGLVKDGLEFKDWRRGVAKNTKAAKKVGQLSLKLENSIAKLSWAPLRSNTLKRYEFHIATLLMGVKSKVTSGENSGKMLLHNFTVCSLSSEKTTKKNFKLKVDLCPDISSRKAIAVWVTEADGHKPIQAIGGLILN